MRYLQTGTGQTGRLDGFVHRLKYSVILVSHMDGIEGVVLGNYLVEGYHLPCVRVASRCIFEPIGKPYCAHGELLIED